MKRRVSICCAAILCVGLFCGLFFARAADGTAHSDNTLTVATVSNRPIYIDRLVYAAFQDIGQQSTVMTAASLQQGYTQANDGERDGVIASTPNMEQLYPHLRRVPVVLERNNVLVFARSGNDLSARDWSSLSGQKAGVLTGRVYIQSQMPPNTVVTSKETTQQVWDGLLRQEYDVAVLSLRAHETVLLPPGIQSVGQIDSQNEYLYMHEKHEALLPVLTAALQDLFADGRGEKILSDSLRIREDLPKTVLHILSFSSDLEREKQLSGRLKELMSEDMPVDWYTFPLDLARFAGETDRLTNLAGLLRKDCVTRDIAAIVVSGDDALAFVKENYFLLFRNVPVVFYGVGAKSGKAIEGFEPYFTGVAQTLPAAETVQAALALFPGTQNLYVVNDSLTEGKWYRAVMEEQLRPLSERLRIEYSRSMSREALLERLGELPENSMVLVGSYFSDSYGRYSTQEEFAQVLAENCSAPVMTFYATDVPYGAVGGKCLDYEAYGEVVAGILKRLLRGEAVSTMPVISDPEGASRWVFNKLLMDKLGVSERALPAGASILNKKVSIWEEEPFFAYGAMLLLLLGMASLLWALFYARGQGRVRKAEQEQQEGYAARLNAALSASEEAARAKSVFLANVSHEIRTPMNSVLGFSELAFDENLPEQTKEYLTKIKTSAEGLLQLINDVLDISKIEAGKIELESILFDIHEVFYACQMVIEPKVREKNIKLFCYAEPSIGKKLRGDPTRLRQALLNLLANAVKFTNAGVVKLMADVVRTEEDSVTLRFEVKDSGIGMSSEQLGRIFEPFVQADDSTTRRYGGTGLGLPITKSIVELMGGNLLVESAVGVGSRFAFELTFPTVDVPFDEAAEKQEIITERPVFAGEVLVCEDNMLNQQVIGEHLKRVGLTVTTVSNGKECIELVTRRMEHGDKPFDLILMDVHMPVMDGLEAAKKLTKLGCQTPIVAVTANVMVSDREIYQEHGMPLLLAKPFTAQDLWRCLLAYMTPVEIRAVAHDSNTAAENRARQERLAAAFVADHQNDWKDIHAAVSRGDAKGAYRIAHALKSVARLMGKDALADAAQVVEQALGKEGAVFSPEQMRVLKRELEKAVSELMPLLADRPQAPKQTEEAFNSKKAARLLDELERQLRNNSFGCVELTDALASIPGTEVLIEQVEAFDFEPALETLAGLRETWGLQS